jgi:hypothetical protein
MYIWKWAKTIRNKEVNSKLKSLVPILFGSPRKCNKVLKNKQYVCVKKKENAQRWFEN